ncbi:MAG TPA: hypothetical protein DEO95_00900 [Ruminococcaceae bacterium]|nr:hypothetical protein [Oscillospiraceae bacterium]
MRNREKLHRWKGKGKENEDACSYWIEFLSGVMGILDVRSLYLGAHLFKIFLPYLWSSVRLTSAVMPPLRQPTTYQLKETDESNVYLG